MSKVRRNFASMAASQLATSLLALMAVAILPNRLGPTTYGVMAVAGAYLGYFALAANLGSNQFLVKVIARDPSQLSRYVVNASVMKLVIGAALAGVAIVGAHILGYHAQTMLLIEIGCLGLIFNAISDILATALQATERMGKLALSSTIKQYLAGGIGLALVLAGRGVVALCLVMACGSLFLVLAYGYHLRSEVLVRPVLGIQKSSIRLDLRLWRSIATGGLPYLSWSFLLLIYGSIDVLMLQQMSGSDPVAWYSLAYGWVAIPVLLPSILVTVIFPSLSNQALRSSSDFTRVVNSSLRIVFLAGAPMAVGLALVASNIVGLFHYPAGFRNTVGLIQILALHVPIAGLDMILATALTAKDRQKSWLAIGCIAAVFNPLVNLIAIPFTSHRFGNGAIGAAIVTVSTEVLILIGAICIRPRGILDRPTISFMMRCALASAVMIPAVLLVGHDLLAVKVAVGVATFVLVCLILRVFRVRTARQFALQALRTLSGKQHEGLSSVAPGGMKPTLGARPVEVPQ
jgi:O-antigen/teichoic acid export membrane protein